MKGNKRNKTGETQKIGREKNRVSLAHNGSQGGNGLLHLIHIPSGELEHRGDRGLLGELQFLQGLVSGLHLSHNHNKERERKGEPQHLTESDR